MITREEIYYAYQFILGREPESEAIYQHYENIESIGELRTILLWSDEFRLLRPQEFLHQSHKIEALRDEELVIFLHPHKTGGTTLLNVLKQNYSNVFPRLVGDILSLTLGDLMTYHLIAGHFDYISTTMIPRPNIKRVSIFREPQLRLLSLYRYYRAHRPEVFGSLEVVLLANRLSPIDFFRHETIVKSTVFNNTYLQMFGASMNRIACDTDIDYNLAQGLAETRIRQLDVIGLTHRMRESISIIAKCLGFRAPADFISERVTDELKSHPDFQAVERIEMTSKLEEAMAPLIVYDSSLYKVAMGEFSKRTPAFESQLFMGYEDAPGLKEA